MKKSTISTIIGIILIIVALFVYKIESDQRKLNKDQGKLEYVHPSNDELTFENLNAITDEEGKQNPFYEVGVTTKNNENLTYYIYLTTDINPKDVRIYLTKVIDGKEEEIITTNLDKCKTINAENAFEENTNHYLIYISDDTTKDKGIFRLRYWLTTPYTELNDYIKLDIVARQVKNNLFDLFK